MPRHYLSEIADFIVFIRHKAIEEKYSYNFKDISHDKYLMADIGVYAISVDSNENALKTFIEQFGTQAFTNVRDVSGKTLWYKYGVNEYPTIYVLDSNKKLIARYLKPEELAATFEKFEKK